MGGGGSTADVERRIGEDLRGLQEHVGGFEFAEVVRAFYRGHTDKNDALQAAALRWLRGEYTTKDRGARLTWASGASSRMSPCTTASS